MNCAPSDLRDFYFNALSPQERTAVEAHLTRCETCRIEYGRLQSTALTLASLPEEEIPRRIAFVSDKVFDPSPWVRWWRAVWLSGARMTTAAALILAFAIVFHSVRQPTRVETVKLIEHTASAPTNSPAFQAAVNQAVTKAVAEQEARYQAKLERVMAQNEKQRTEIIRASEIFDAYQKQNQVNLVATNRMLESGQ